MNMRYWGPFQHRRNRRRPEDAQTLLMFVFFIVVLFVFVGFGIDVGFAYITKANLSKAVDAACLAGMRNLSQGTLTAQSVAISTFQANYGRPGRDTGTVTPTVQFGFDANNNRVLNVSAAATINTFFIRVMPAIGGANFSTLQVGASAQATRNKLIMSIVLDRSGSMANNGGGAVLPGDVSDFINRFDDNVDRAAMVSFSYAARTDVTMRQPFKADIKTAANALTGNFAGWTCSERGLTNGLAQINTVNVQTNEYVIKVMVFFTDGMANTWYWSGFNCGPRNIAPDKSLYDPNTGASAESGCTVPNPITSIDGSTAVDTRGNTQNSCISMHDEAEKRAEAVARLARSQGIIIYSIGFGNPAQADECNGYFRSLNPDFLKNIANTPDSNTFDNRQPVGDYGIAATPGEIKQVFDAIAAKILLRLTQ